MALEPAKLTDFRVAGALGSGTTSKVYEAVHLATGREVAIKVLEPSEAGSEIRERFAREALLLSEVDSRYVGKILGFGFEQGQPFLVLERLRGETLDAKLRRDGPVPVHTAMRWFEQLIAGIGDVHAAKIIHRDIKPANIFIDVVGGAEIAKVIDFGVGRLKEIASDGGGLTSTNHLIGSMGYMAPEQFLDAKSVDFTADLYAIGVVVFRTLTGRLPFVSRSLEAVIRMKAENEVPLVSSMPGMPQNRVLDHWVKKAMSRAPRDRFQTSREMLEGWWAVMASLEEESTTDIMGSIGRVDESYAGRLPEPHPADEEDRTVRHAAPLIDPASIPPSTQRDPELDEDMTTKNDPNLRKLVEQELALRRLRMAREK